MVRGVSLAENGLLGRLDGRACKRPVTHGNHHRGVHRAAIPTPIHPENHPDLTGNQHIGFLRGRGKLLRSDGPVHWRPGESQQCAAGRLGRQYDAVRDADDNVANHSQPCARCADDDRVQRAADSDSSKHGSESDCANHVAAVAADFDGIVSSLHFARFTADATNADHHDVDSAY